jgi:hypothetical protein
MERTTCADMTRASGEALLHASTARHSSYNPLVDSPMVREAWERSFDSSAYAKYASNSFGCTVIDIYPGFQGSLIF